MSSNSEVNILIAEDNEISRELMAGILKTQGFSIVPASDGDEAIDIVEKQTIDLALVDLNMEPKGGFAFIKHLKAYGIDIPVVIITADDSSDILMLAGELGVSRVLQKPVEPDRLISLTKNILKRHGHNLNFIPSTIYESSYTHDQLMQRAIELAERNARTGKGGPFGALITDENGKVIGEGVNGISSRFDPTAHAEIMAIRQAAERLERSNLSNCTLYCSSEPTMMGQALIISVGIKQVYYGLSHADITEIRETENKVRAEMAESEGQKKQTTYTQIGNDHAITMLKRWQRDRQTD